MKDHEMREDSRQALKAMRRAAYKVLSQAVRDNEEIPLWDGEKVVWRVPHEEASSLKLLVDKDA